MIFMRARTGAPLDRDSNQAVKGRADEAFVSRVLANAFFGQSCPKSLDRNAFAFADIGLPDFSVVDEAATVSALTATFAASAWFRIWRWPPRDWIVAGGNAQSDGGVGWSSHDRVAGLRLPRRTHVNGLPLTFPTTTGAARPTRSWRCRNAAQLTGPLI